MAYKLKRKESVEDGLVRVVRDQLEKSVDELTSDDLDRHEGVHQCRKRLKKVRAALRICRPALGKAYGEENAWFRDVAREFSRVRDAEAMIETFDALVERFEDELRKAPFEAVREALVDRRQQIADEEIDLDERVDALVERLRAKHEAVGFWKLDEKGFDAVGPGLAKTYSRARDRMEEAYDAGTDAALHEWRKRVKYHRYHMRLLRPLWPKVVNGRRRGLHDLTNLLGEAHDLVVLASTLEADPKAFGGDEAVAALAGLAMKRREELLEEAKPLGRKAFAEKPKRFVKRIEAWWDAWRA